MKKNYISVILVVFFIPLLACFVSGCRRSNVDMGTETDVDSTANPMNATWTHPTAVPGGSNLIAKNSLDGIVNYGGNVYYFPFRQEVFANRLAYFVLTHTNLEVSAMTGNIVRMHCAKISDQNSIYGFATEYGVAIGYFVTFREKN